MPEVIKNYVAPIAVIPKQSIMAAEIHQLKAKISRTKAKEKREILMIELNDKEKNLESYLRSMGR